MPQPEPGAEKPSVPPWMPSGIFEDPPEYSDETRRGVALQAAALWSQGSHHRGHKDVIEAARAFEAYLKGE